MYDDKCGMSRLNCLTNSMRVALATININVVKSFDMLDLSPVVKALIYFVFY